MAHRMDQECGARPGTGVFDLWSVHLWFRTFPNWRLAILAAVAGVFYGAAFNRTKSIRASMVTHALVVTTWRVFFW
jgi:membrane protease YdiL (CAAX protease family)